MSRTSNIILCVGICLGVLGACLLVGFGVRYLKPYLEVRTMEKGQCTVTSTTGIIEQQFRKVTCKCGRDSTSPCRSQYYCVKVMVNFTSKDVVLMHNVTLYDSPETFLVQNLTSLQCSFHKCDRVEARNHEALKRFVKRYANQGDTYPCYYEPSQRWYAIVSVVDLATAVNTILWPSLALLCGAAIVLGYVFCTGDSSRGSFPTSSLDRVKNINRDVNRYERVETRYAEAR